MPETTVVRYTTAPVEYDGFGTLTICVVGILDGKKPVRKISCQAQHVRWQEARNGSGMHPTFTPEEFAEVAKQRWFTPMTEGSTHDHCNT